MAYSLQTFSPATPSIRPQIVEAVEVICARHLGGNATTAIVAPPRVGKSNIIRLSALELTQMGHACAALALVPWDTLADQLTNQTQLNKMVRHYPLNRARVDNFRALRVSKLTPNMHESGKVLHLMTGTIQLARLNLTILSTWLDRCAFYGARPLVYVDEGQLLSVADGSKWGEIATLAKDKGAHVVLLTGTPYRADNEAIPGFSVRRVNEQTGTYVAARRLDDKHVEKKHYDTVSCTQILDADYEMPLRDAWAQNIIAHVEPEWVNVYAETGEMLSTLPKAAARKALRAAVTHESTMREALTRACADVVVRRAGGQKNAGMLVVTCSDVTDDGVEVDTGTANWHARQVARILRDLQPTWDAVIATQAEDDPSKKTNAGVARLNKFVNDGIGDALVVKNMGTVGMDCERIKTVVLLSTTRQLATWIQTILRGATKWGEVATYTLVLTDDPMNRDNYVFAVKDEGGEQPHVDSTLTKVEIVESEKKEKPDDKFVPVAARTVETGDSRVDTVLTDTEEVDRVCKAMPELRVVFSRVQIAEKIKAGLFVVPEPSAEDPPISAAEDLGVAKRKLGEDIEAYGREWAQMCAPYGNDMAAWVDAKRVFVGRAKRHAGITVRVPEENDIDKLTVMVRWMADQIAARKQAAA